MGKFNDFSTYDGEFWLHESTPTLGTEPVTRQEGLSQALRLNPQNYIHIIVAILYLTKL